MTYRRRYLLNLAKHGNQSGYFQLLGMEIQESEEGKSRIRVPVDERHLNPMGTVHGGVYCSALDAAIFFACLTKLPRGEKMTTVEVKVNFLIPARAGEIFAEGSVIYQGRSIMVGEGRVVDANGLLLATGISTCMILPRSKPVEGAMG